MLEKDLEIKDTDKQRRKLVDYFNQWWEEKFGEKGYFKYTMRFDEVHLISKKMGFIKWLVDNDKIDFEKDKYGIILYENGVQKFLKSEEEILMELSIQESPIEYLISILK